MLKKFNRLGTVREMLTVSTVSEEEEVYIYSSSSGSVEVFISNQMPLAWGCSQQKHMENKNESVDDFAGTHHGCDL